MFRTSYTKRLVAFWFGILALDGNYTNLSATLLSGTFVLTLKKKKSIFHQLTATHWVFSLFLGPDTLEVKIPVDQQ